MRSVCHLFFSDFLHSLSDAHIVALSARTESDNHGAGEDLRTCRDVRGQSVKRGGQSRKKNVCGRVRMHE